MKQAYNIEPLQIVKTSNRLISIFSIEGQNIDQSVVETFGDEWLKFNKFSNEALEYLGSKYFDILDEKMINKGTYCLDVGCGTGRWTKYLSERIGFIEAIDPSDAVFAADKVLQGIDNVRITKASVETIPFDDETFDFVMSIGVLHHIPNTQNAMTDCVKKVKKGGYFYCYLYYNLDNRGPVFRLMFQLSDIIRRVVSKFPSGLKKFVCDILAVILYMPFVGVCKFLKLIGLDSLAKKIPLYDYAGTSFFVIRNDALDRFGTTLEQRFSKDQVIEMMSKSGLQDIIVGPDACFYHAVGMKK